MKKLSLSAIGFYQRHISPYKGFCCAYRVHTGCASCSTLGFRAIQRFGFWRGIQVLRQRLLKCGIAHRRYSAKPAVLQRQGGFCDLSCDLPCDFDFGGAARDVLSSCGPPSDCGDWGRSEKQQKEEKWVHIPPKSRTSGSVL